MLNLSSLKKAAMKNFRKNINHNLRDLEGIQLIKRVPLQDYLGVSSTQRHKEPAPTKHPLEGKRMKI
jgi:hypothetical protein